MSPGRYLPWVVVVATAMLIGFAASPPKDLPGDMRVQQFAQLPVISDGRIKPWDTLARNSLMRISGRQSFADERDRSQPAIKWLLDVISRRPEAYAYKVFRIENEGVLSLLDLPKRSGFRYAIDEFSSKIDKIGQEATRAQKVEEKRRDLYDVKIMELAGKLELYSELAQLRLPHDVPPSSAGQEWETSGKIAEQARSLAGAQLDQVMREGKFDLSKLNEEQQQLLARELIQRAQKQINPAAAVLATLRNAYRDGDTERFNKNLGELEQYFDSVPEATRQRARSEVFFNDFEPFYVCCILYCVVFVLSCISFALAAISFDTLSRPLNWTAFGLAALTLVIHTGALVARMYLMDRPLVFVTNLYSSAIFIGWGCVAMGLIIEAIFQIGIGNLVGSILGFLTVLVAHQLHLWESKDTLEMMQAVLDTNFWLSTHVTCVTLGYTATFVAGFLGILFVLLGVATPILNRDLLKVLSQMIYGVICFATLLSFTGTVLGGLWADYSWGRFWGWDPKENGALLIVIWNALILHARWSGMVKQRGMAVLTIVGNMVTGWSWFGTNQLGVGLHAYGFNNKLALGLTIFWAVMGAMILIGMLPTKYWWSFNAQKGPAGRSVA